MAARPRKARSRGSPGRSAGARSWRQDPAGRRQRILDAAAGEFAREGYLRARVADIARRAEVSEGSIYVHFPNKQALLVAVGERYGQGLARAAFGDEPAALDADNIARVIEDIFRYVRETDDSLAAFLLSGDPEEGGRAQGANRAAMLDAIETALRRGIDAGSIAPLANPRISAQIQFGLVEAALRDCFLHGGGRDEASYCAEVSRCLRAYLTGSGLSSGPG